MRIVATYIVFDDNDRQEVIEGTKEFDLDFEAEDASEAIQDVVEAYETDGLTIDQGGDDDEYSFDFPDGCALSEESDFRADVHAFLDDIRVALEEVERDAEES